MKRVFLGATMWLAAMGGVASASDLYTAPFWGGGSASRYVLCKIANVTAKDKLVQIRLLDSAGNAVSDSGEITLTAGTSYSQYGGSSLSSNVRCHFHGAGGKGGYRAHATYVSTEAPFNGNDVFTVPAN